MGTSVRALAQAASALIDEIDKGDIDFPNDLLNVFERGELEIPELARMGHGPVDVRVDGGVETPAIGRRGCTAVIVLPNAWLDGRHDRRSKWPTRGCCWRCGAAMGR